MNDGYSSFKWTNKFLSSSTTRWAKHHILTALSRLLFLSANQNARIRASIKANLLRSRHSQELSTWRPSLLNSFVFPVFKLINVTWRITRLISSRIFLTAGNMRRFTSWQTKWKQSSSWHIQRHVITRTSLNSESSSVVYLFKYPVFLGAVRDLSKQENISLPLPHANHASCFTERAVQYPLATGNWIAWQ